MLTGLESAAVKKELQRHRSGERSVLSNGADAENGTDCDGAGKHQQGKEGGHGEHPPSGKYRGLGSSIDVAPPLAPGKSAVSGKSEDDTGGGDGAALADEELSDDVEREHGEAGLFPEHLQAQTAKWLTILTGHHIGDVLHGVDDDQDDGKS